MYVVSMHLNGFSLSIQDGIICVYFFILADIPSPVVVIIGIMVHLSTRERVNRRRGQGNVGPIRPIGFSRFRASLCFLLLSSLST